MENVIDSFTSPTAIIQVTDISLEKAEACPLLGSDETLHLVQITLMPGGKVVQADHALIKLEQGFQQVGTDKTCHTGDKPGPRGLREFL